MKTFPLYNLNGSSPQSMAEDFNQALLALEAARLALLKVTPHGRDYQPDPPVYQDALKEHMERIHSLDVICADMERLLMDAVDGGQHRGEVVRGRGRLV